MTLQPFLQSYNPCICHSTTHLFIGDFLCLTSILAIFTWESKAEEQVSSALTAYPD